MEMDTTTGDDGYDVLREVRNLMAGIEFDDEHPAPANQRVRAFLSEAVNAAWANARVTSYQMPGGAHTHLAFARAPFQRRGEALIVVAEALDGTLSIPFPASYDVSEQVCDAQQLAVPDEAEEERREDEVHSLRRILLAFRKISRLVVASDTKPREKTLMLEQLTNAASRLTSDLERMMH